MKGTTAMKAVRTVIKTVLIFAVFMIVLLAVSIYLILPKKIDPKDYAAYVNKNIDTLTEVAEEYYSHGSETYGVKHLTLRKGHIQQIWTQEDRVIFSMDSQYAPMEGHIQLLYFPDGEYVFSIDDHEWNSVETGDENILRWEGGMAGKGYVNVTRMSDCFYLEEAYLPT